MKYYFRELLDENVGSVGEVTSHNTPTNLEDRFLISDNIRDRYLTSHGTQTNLEDKWLAVPTSLPI